MFIFYFKLLVQIAAWREMVSLKQQQEKQLKEYLLNTGLFNWCLVYIQKNLSSKKPIVLKDDYKR